MPAQRFVSRPDTAWIGQGTAFSTPKAKRRCTLLVVWYAGQEEPWIILTDLAPDKVGPSWYALRFWIELGFKACPRPRPGGHKEPGLEVGQDPAHRPHPRLPTLAGALGGDPPGSGLLPLRIALRDPRSRPARTQYPAIVRGRLWSRVWLLPEPWPEPKPNLEVRCCLTLRIHSGNRH